MTHGTDLGQDSDCTTAANRANCTATCGGVAARSLSASRPKAPVRAADTWCSFTFRPVTTVLLAAGVAGIAAKSILNSDRYRALMAITSTNVVNVARRPLVSLLGSGFVFPSWSNVSYLALAIAATQVTEVCGRHGRRQAAAAILAGHIGVSAATAGVQHVLIKSGKAPASWAHTPDDVGASYLAYAAVAGAAVAVGQSCSRAKGLPVVGAIVVAAPAFIATVHKPSTTNVGHLCAALSGALAAYVCGAGAWVCPSSTGDG